MLSILGTVYLESSRRSCLHGCVRSMAKLWRKEQPSIRRSLYLGEVVCHRLYVVNGLDVDRHRYMSLAHRKQYSTAATWQLPENLARGWRDRALAPESKARGIDWSSVPDAIAVIACEGGLACGAVRKLAWG